MRRFLATVLSMALLALGCSAEEPPLAETDIRPGKIENTTGPYVSVAVDNHFHDVHEEDDISFDAARRFVVRNEGSNLHNVTIPGIGYSKDVRTGRSVSLALEPGTYTLICRYHPESDMRGSFTVE